MKRGSHSRQYDAFDPAFPQMSCEGIQLLRNFQPLQGGRQGQRLIQNVTKILAFDDLQGVSFQPYPHIARNDGAKPAPRRSIRHQSPKMPR